MTSLKEWQADDFNLAGFKEYELPNKQPTNYLTAFVKENQTERNKGYGS
jgi:hypothetical protein